MGGRYGGNIKRRNEPQKTWRLDWRSLEAIGAATRPDLEAIGRRTRRLAKAAIRKATPGPTPSKQEN